MSANGRGGDLFSVGSRKMVKTEKSDSERTRWYKNKRRARWYPTGGKREAKNSETCMEISAWIGASFFAAFSKMWSTVKEIKKKLYADVR